MIPRQLAGPDSIRRRVADELSKEHRVERAVSLGDPGHPENLEAVSELVAHLELSRPVERLPLCGTTARKPRVVQHARSIRPPVDLVTGVGRRCCAAAT